MVAIKALLSLIVNQIIRGAVYTVIKPALVLLRVLAKSLVSFDNRLHGEFQQTKFNDETFSMSALKVQSAKKNRGHEGT